MPKDFSIEEKIYNKMLLLQANDDFMVDVLALRKKVKETEPEVVAIDDNEDLITFYDETLEYDNEVRGLIKKYNLSRPFFMQLSFFIPNNKLIEVPEHRSFVFFGCPMPKLIPQIEPKICTDENGEEEMVFTDDVIRDNQKVAIEIFPETTLNDFINNWDNIAEERDKLYGIKSRKNKRFAKSKNIIRDLEIYNLKKQGKKCVEIRDAINADKRFGNEKIDYQEVSKIIKRLKEKAKSLVPSKET